MNILKKVSLTALGTSLIATSAFAGSMDVTGSAGITLGNQSNHTNSNSFSMTDEITFTGSGEMDNGWNVTVSMQLDDNASGNSSNLDNRSVKIDMGDSGTLTFYGHGGDSALSAVDDVMPTAYGESWDVIGLAAASVTAGQTAKFGSISGNTGNSSFMYNAPELMSDLAINVSYNPSNSTEPNGSTSASIAYTGVTGLTLGYAMDESGSATTNEYTTAYAKYASEMGITVGVQSSENDEDGGSSNDDELEIMGITYQVNDDLTIGYTQSEYNAGDKSLDQESSNMSVSYTTGGMTIAAAMVEMNNVGGSALARDDIEGYEIDVSFAF
jgi:outer membrane protein OmpU